MIDRITNEVPEYTFTDSYIIPTLGLDEGSLVFKHLGSFFSYITPHELPVDVVRDVLHSKVSMPQLILEALKVESGFICAVVIFILISLLPICFTCGWCCSRSTKNHHHYHNASDINSSQVDSLMTYDESWEVDINCTKRGLFIFLQILILLSISCVVAMFITNEQISTAVDKTPHVIRSSLKDLELFLHNTNHQIIFTLNEGLNLATERVKVDLEDIDKLLGEPIQKELSSNTGIEVLFESIINICTVNTEIIQRIQLLRTTLSKVIQLSQNASLKMEELQTQLSVLLRQCSYRDRPLCDTLRMKTFEDMGVIGAFRQLQTDQLLIKMMSVGEAEIDGTRKNLSIELNVARSKFRGYPLQIEEETISQRTEIIRELASMKDVAQLSSRTLTSTVEHLIDRINIFWDKLGPTFHHYHEAGNMFWALALSACILILLVTLLLLGALSCGCCYADNKASVTLIACGVAISIASISLGMFAIVYMLTGGHGAVFICRPFFDAPDYKILEKLFDKPGLIYENEPTNGIFDNLLRPPGPEVEPFTVSLGSVLKNCEKNCSAFSTFELNKLINISALTDLKQFQELDESFENLTASEYHLADMTNNLQIILHTMLQDSSINLTRYRYEIGHPTPEKDISTFADQMQRVSLQIQDVATASRMTTLGSRARRLQSTIMRPLEQLRGDVLYHLTALELQQEPWRHQVNLTLIHLKTIQFYLNRDSHDLCQNRSKYYINRLKNHLETNKNVTIDKLTKTVAPCGPIYQIFNGLRVLTCDHIIQPLNGIWFIASITLFLWTIVTPAALLLATTYRKIKNGRRLRHTNSHQAPSENLIISEQSNWGSTLGVGPGNPSDIDRSNWKIYIIDTNDGSIINENTPKVNREEKLNELGITYIYLNEDLSSEYLI